MNESVVSLRKLEKELRERTICVSEEHCKTEICTIWLDLLSHVGEGLDTFGTVRCLDASIFEYFNMVFKRAYRRWSVRRKRKRRETPCVQHLIVKGLLGN